MRKSTTQRGLYKSYIVLALAICVTVVISRWAWGHYERNLRAQELYREASIKSEKTHERLEELQKRNALLDTETGKQDVLINRYALKLPGERVLILVEDTSLETPVIQEKTPTLWEKITGWF